MASAAALLVSKRRQLKNRSRAFFQEDFREAPGHFQHKTTANKLNTFKGPLTLADDLLAINGYISAGNLGTTKTWLFSPGLNDPRVVA